MVEAMSDDEFDALVQHAIDSLPMKIFNALDNVVFFVENEPTRLGENPENREILGIYEGTPLTERDSGWSSGALPDSITIFKNPVLRSCANRQEIIHEIGVTVVHEVAHFFGINDEKLDDFGWG